MIIIVITWICQCCRRKDDNQRTRKSVRNLTITLFTLSILCLYVFYKLIHRSRLLTVFFSIFLSACFYGNEHVNRSVGKSVNGLDDIQRNLKQATHEWGLLSQLQDSASHHVEDLVRIIDKKTQETPNINKTVSSIHFFD